MKPPVRTTQPTEPATPHGNRRFLPRNLPILHEDDDFIVINKPPGLLATATDRIRERTAEYMLSDYVRKGCARSKKRVFAVHRLDRDTSGVLVFAKCHEMRKRIQEKWTDVKKLYLAVVRGRCMQKSGVLSSYLAENEGHVVYSTPDPEKGKLAKTAYKVLKESAHYSLLEIDLLTGRKNQIRVHLADMGHPIVGDEKYSRLDVDRGQRLLLHAKSITFVHPSTGQRVTFEASVPPYFQAMLERDKPAPPFPARPSGPHLRPRRHHRQGAQPHPAATGPAAPPSAGRKERPSFPPRPPRPPRKGPRRQRP